MQITLVVGAQARQLRPESDTPAEEWHAEAAGDTRPLAPDEQTLLDALTRLCRRILVEDGPSHPLD